MSTPEWVTLIATGFTLLMMPIIFWNLYRAGHNMAHMPGSRPRVRWWWCSFCKEDR